MSITTLCLVSEIKYSHKSIRRPDLTKDFDITKPDTNFVLTSGAIRGTLTQPRFSKKLIMSTHEQITNNPTGNVRQKLSPTLAAHRRENAKRKRAERQTQRGKSTTDLWRRASEVKLRYTLNENRTTLNLRHQLPEQNPEEGAETGIPEAHRHTQVFSKDLGGTDPLLHGLGREKKEACLIGWEAKGRPASSAVLLGHVRKEILYTRIRALVSEDLDAQAMSKHTNGSGGDPQQRTQGSVEIHHISKETGNLRRTSWKDIRKEVLDVEGASGVHERISARVYARNTHPGKSGQAQDYKEHSLWRRAMSVSPLSVKKDGTESPLMIVDSRTWRADTLCIGYILTTTTLLSSLSHIISIISSWHPQKSCLKLLHKTPQMSNGIKWFLATLTLIGFSGRDSIWPPWAKIALPSKKIGDALKYTPTAALDELHGYQAARKGRKELCSLLKQNLDIFAWKPADMTGGPSKTIAVAPLELSWREGYSPV
ncbi:hypothetical protein Tco_0312132 [Tanacetum coccineum]